MRKRVSNRLSRKRNTYGVWAREAWPISAAFRLVGVLPPALRSMELNLRSLPAEIYTLSGWTKGFVTSKRFARQAQLKNKLLSFSA